MNAFIQLLLMPFSLLYGLGIGFRNFLFDFGLRSSKSYSFPVVSIGNLSVGGTGKTPHTEFIIQVLSEQYNLATLSRGYGRKTKGFRIANENDNATTIGDEPYQLFSKFNNIIVSVDEKRQRGIDELIKLPAPPKVILLDDAFQHRQVKAGLNILLTDYSKLYINDFLLPAGRLREGIRAAKRADIIVITKSPKVLSPLEIRRITSLLKPQEYQKVFFSYIQYLSPRPLNEEAELLNIRKKDLDRFGVLMVSAIANPKPLKAYLNRYAKELQNIDFPDHHFFSEKDYTKIKQALDTLLSPRKIIIITEKDAVKFDANEFKDVPVFYIPISIDFHQHGEESFTEEINKYVRSYTTSR